MDRLTPTKRSWLMSRIRGRNTKPEMTVRRTLHRAGYRYRLHASDLPGKPDLVFASRRRVIFVHGCFWHGHSCKYGRAQSKTNRRFWTAKLRANRLRDTRSVRRLRGQGWRVLVIWECAVKRSDWFPVTAEFLDAPTTDSPRPRSPSKLPDRG